MNLSLKYFVTLFIVGLLFLSANSQLVYAAADPIAYWKFDDGLGTAPIDSSGNNITGSFLTPNPTWSTDVPSDISFSDPYSLDFSNYHDGVTFAWPSGLNFSSNAPRSFSFWYKPTGNGEPDAGSFDRILSWDSDAFEIAGTFGNVATHEIAFYDGSWRDTGYALTVGTWYHITFTYDGTSARFYVANDLKYNQAEGGRALSGTMAIGTRQNGHNEGINGRIDDVRVYNYALDIGQIENLTAGSSDPDAPPATPTPTPTIAPTPGSSNNTTSSNTSSSSLCSGSTLAGTPNVYQIDASIGAATLYFVPVSGADGYTISYGVTPSADQYATTLSNGDQSGAVAYTINSLDTNTTYYFKVKGTKGCSSSNWSNIASIKISQSTGLLSQLANAFTPEKKITIVKSNVAPVLITPTPTDTPITENGISLDVKVLGTDNKPLAGVQATLHSKVQITKTDKNGVAHFTNVEKGEHQVLLAYNDYTGEQHLTVDGTKKEQTLIMQVKLTNGIPWGWFIMNSLVSISIIGCLIFFLLKKRNKEQSVHK